MSSSVTEKSNSCQVAWGCEGAEETLKSWSSFSPLYAFLSKDLTKSIMIEGQRVGEVWGGHPASNIPNDPLWGLDLYAQLSLVTQSLCEIPPKPLSSPLCFPHAASMQEKLLFFLSNKNVSLFLKKNAQ